VLPLQGNNFLDVEQKINSYIEHTLLKVDTTQTDVKRLCEEATQHSFAAVCIPPPFVREARRSLGEMSKVKIVTVVAFPMGYSALPAKTEEIKRAVDEGADEIDGVLNIAAVKSGLWNIVENDIEGMAFACNLKGKPLKLILEMGLLSLEELERVVQLAHQSRVKFLKTSTGMHGHPTTPEMVRLLRKMADPALKIKASGDIKTLEVAQQLLQAGADRIGTSSALQFL
jgi:deoxyribose-phosphate aldolase